MNENKILAISALEQLRGDDLWRARKAFEGLTEEEMGRLYFNSGKTKRQILSEYEAHDAKVNKAIAWVKSL